MTHLNSQGQFVSDKYEIFHIGLTNCVFTHGEGNCGLNKLVLSLNDPEAIPVLRIYAEKTSKKELGKDILKALDNLKV